MMKPLSSYISPKVRLLFAGDAMQHTPQLKLAEEHNFDYSEYWKNIKRYVAESDFAVVNLECTLSGKPYTGYPCFSAPDQYAESLRDAGFDLFLTSNNHCLDYGLKGLTRTIDVLDNLKVDHIGTYKNPPKQQAYVISKNGINIGFLNYSFGVNNEKELMNIPEYSVSLFKMSKIMSDIQNIRSKVDLLICCLHFGMEYHVKPTQYQKKLVSTLRDWGVDMVIGSHPHVPGIISWDDDHLVAYSLGNFMADQDNPRADFKTHGGIMLTVDISKTGNKVNIDKVTPILTYIDKQENNYVLTTTRDETVNVDEFDEFVEFTKKLLKGEI